MIQGMTLFFFTRDDARMKVFYERVLGGRFASHGPHWHQQAAGTATFALHGAERGDEIEDVHHLFFGFNVADVAAVVARAREAGGEIVKDVHDEAFGKVALIRDPEGRLLRFVQH